MMTTITMDEILMNILEFLTANEFATITTLNKEFLKNNRYLFHRIWLSYLSKAWNLPLEFVKTIDFSEVEMRTFYPYAKPVIYSLNIMSELFEYNPTKNSIVFNGAIGHGYRSIQSTTSFPASKGLIPSHTVEEYSKIITNLVIGMLNCIKFEFLSPEMNRYSHQFSTPIVVSCSETKDVINITPRCISYYEIEVEATKHSDSYISQIECFAVGLSTNNFVVQEKLPGWDNESYGYHSDDGGIFHGTGRKLSQYGPTFGPGDTVGCGFNHKNHSIFYTLNGKFLGTAFYEVSNNSSSASLVLYPTVGIDAREEVKFNFGMNPFRFNLVEYCQDWNEQRDIDL